jgi:hypothetical protein
MRFCVCQWQVLDPKFAQRAAEHLNIFVAEFESSPPFGQVAPQHNNKFCVNQFNGPPVKM